MVYSIHLLRFIASFAVLISHSANVLNVHKTIVVGDAGVDIFFIISGFVIGLAGPKETSAYSFYVKRFIRVIPLYWLALAAFIAFRFYMWRLVPDEGDLAHSFFLVPRAESGWFPILFPAWTLSYEMLFYAVFGIVLAIDRENARLYCIFGFAALSSINVPLLSTAMSTPLFVEFAAGLALAHLYAEVRKPNQGLGVALILAAAVCFFLNRSTEEGRIVTWGVPSLMLAIGMLNCEGATFLRSRAVEVLGGASYAIYLFHITAMAAMREAVASLLHIDMRQYPGPSMAVLVAVSLVAGVTIHLWVEKPLMRALRGLLAGKKRRSTEAAKGF